MSSTDNCGIRWDDADITPGDRCRFDASLIEPADARFDGGVNWQTIPAGRYAIYRCEVMNHDFGIPQQASRNSVGLEDLDQRRGHRFRAFILAGFQNLGTAARGSLEIAGIANRAVAS